MAQEKEALENRQANAHKKSINNTIIIKVKQPTLFLRQIITTTTIKFFQQVFIYSRPIAGIRAKLEHETTYLQTSKCYVKNIFMHFGFKYVTDQHAIYQLRTLIQRSGTVLTRHTYSHRNSPVHVYTASRSINPNTKCNYCMEKIKI